MFKKIWKLNNTIHNILCQKTHKKSAETNFTCDKNLSSKILHTINKLIEESLKKATWHKDIIEFDNLLNNNNNTIIKKI